MLTQDEPCLLSAHITSGPRQRTAMLAQDSIVCGERRPFLMGELPRVVSVC